MTSTEFENLRGALVYGFKDKFSAQALENAQKAIGQTKTDEGFMSTTSDPDVAHEWGDYTGADFPVVLELDTGGTVNGVDVAAEGLENEDEPQKEILLNKGQSYEITGLKAENGSIVVQARLVNSQSKDHLKEDEEESEEEPSRNDDKAIISDVVGTAKHKIAFHKLGENNVITRKMFDTAIDFLKHRSGTTGEDIAYIDSRNGKTTKNTSLHINRATYPTDEMKQMALDSEDGSIIVIHNHPTNGFPSYSDIKGIMNKKFKYGVIACHDGTVMKYSVIGPINEAEIEFRLKDLGRLSHNDSDKESLQKAIDNLRERAKIAIEVIHP